MFWKINFWIFSRSLTKKINLEKNASSLIKRTEEFIWKGHLIKIEIRISSKYRLIYDMFIYVDNELVAQTSNEKCTEVYFDCRNKREPITKELASILLKKLRSDVAEGFFTHQNNRVPIKVEMKNNFDISIKESFSLFGAVRYFLVEIDGEVYIVGKRVGKRVDTVLRKRVGKRVDTVLISKPLQWIIGIPLLLIFIWLLIMKMQ